MPMQFRQALLDALCAAFDEGELEMLLFGALNVRLDDIAAPGAFPDRVRQVIEWAERNQRLEELVHAAAAERKDSPELKAFVKRYSRLIVPARTPSAREKILTRGEVEARDLRETVEMMVRALQGDQFTKQEGIIPRLNSYIDVDQAWKRATERRIWALEEAMKRRVWPWLIAGSGIAVGIIGITMAWAERFL